MNTWFRLSSGVAPCQRLVCEVEGGGSDEEEGQDLEDKNLKLLRALSQVRK